MTRSNVLDHKVYIEQRRSPAILGVTDRTIPAMIANGRLRGYRLGPRVIRLRLDEVENALQPMRV